MVSPESADWLLWIMQRIQIPATADDVEEQARRAAQARRELQAVLRQGQESESDP